MSAVDPMPTSPLQASAGVLAANEEFYAAFSHGDLKRMSKLWATESLITCAHPGMQLLQGRDAVMRSWNALLRVPPEVPLNCFSPRVQLLGEAALVTCYEGAGTGPAHLAATNIYVREAGEWRLIHHQAGPLQHPLRVEPQPSGLN
jgi:ketosteroid isomerase-like protein